MKSMTRDRLHQLLDYDRETGAFTWLVNRRGGVKAGDAAKSIGNNGYVRITIDGVSYLAHRLAWLSAHGEMPSAEIDHIDRVKTNNKLSNLRCVTRSENQQNMLLIRSNTSGFRGVSWISSLGKWQAAIRVNGRRIQLGLFHAPEDAYRAYLQAASRFHTANPFVAGVAI